MPLLKISIWSLNGNNFFALKLWCQSKENIGIFFSGVSYLDSCDLKESNTSKEDVC